jgi:ribonucleoside-triphosphate reductase
MANATKVAHYAKKAGHTLPTQVVKRDGRQVVFDINRIENAVSRSFAQCEEPISVSASEVAERAASTIAARALPDEAPSVEQIQDAVELVLQSSGAYEAAKKFILHRAQHADDRKTREVPDEIKATFADAAQYFPTDFQQFMFFDKYSKYNYDLGRRETWIETVTRTIDFLREMSHDKLDDETYASLHKSILNMESMPSMRLLATAGDYARDQNLAIFNCFAGSEKYLTPEGLVTFADTVNTEQIVLNGSGKWVNAEIKQFGHQSLQVVSLRPGRKSSLRHQIQVTPNHRWITLNRGEVTDLQVGDRIEYVGATHTTFIPEAWIAGFGFGDGTIDGQGNARVRLCGEKDQHWLNVFQEYGHSGICYPPSCNGDPIITFHKGWFSDWKKLPSVERGSEWLASWLEGYMAADGHRAEAQPGLSSQNNDAIEFVKMIAPLCGYLITGHNVSSVMTTNLGPRKAALQRLTLRRQGEFWVTAIEDLEVRDTVFCAVVPDTHDFVLANGVLTGNCSYLPIKDIESFCETLLISMSGCGVGFSVESYYVDQFPRVRRQKKNQEVTIHVIEDSTEGWINVLRDGLTHWFNGEDMEWDDTFVRRAGLPLRKKGGRASGPGPLNDMLRNIRRIILSRQGTFIRPIDAHDIACSVGDAAVQGGVRRTAMISLFDWDDNEMRQAKIGVNLDNNPIRWNANNSAVWPEDLTQQDLIQQMLDMDKGKRGEPGIFSRENAKKNKPSRRKSARFGINPCGEINLRPYGLCNLSIAVVRPDDDLESLKAKVVNATILGTIQSMAENFPGLRPEWAENQREERLLGVDPLGLRDHPILSQVSAQADEWLRVLKEVATETNIKYAALLDIAPSAAITCDKPGGNSSATMNTNSGLDGRHSPFIRRNARVAGTSPVFRAFKEDGVPMTPENGQTIETATAWVVPFPLRSPETSVFKADLTAIDQLEYWLQLKTAWTDHNPSCTIVYSDDELLDITKWVWEHRDKIGGLAFLPRDDAAYNQMPYEEITEAEYDALVLRFPAKIDFSKIFRYELEDMTTATSELSCFAGACET